LHIRQGVLKSISMNVYLKIPSNFSCSIHTQKAYIAYLWFKKDYSQGILPPIFRGEDRFTNNYWKKKLIALGWIREDFGRLQLVAYQDVWRMMSIKKCKRTRKKVSRLAFRYVKINPKVGLSRKNFHLSILRTIREQLVEKKKCQIAFRLNVKTFASKTQLKRHIKSLRQDQKPEFSSLASKKLFGFKSETSGWKLLKEHFKLHGKSELRVMRTEKARPFFRYTSSRISLV